MEPSGVKMFTSTSPSWAPMRRLLPSHSGGSSITALLRCCLMLALVCLLAPGRADAQAPTVTATSLNITQLINQVNQKVIQAPLGVPVTLTATVKMYNGNPVFTGTVTFCDGSVITCLNGHALGTQSLVVPTGPQNAGTAHLTITPPGTHKYEAVFMG